MTKNLVLYLAEDTKNAQYRYRVSNIEATCKKSQSWRVEVFLKSYLEKVYKELENATFLIIERQTAKDNVIIKLIKTAKANGVKVIFDLDDLIFDYRDLPLLMRATNSRNIFYWFGYFSGIRRIAKRSDGFLTTNDFLAKKLARSFSRPVAVIPNSLNFEQIEISKKSLEQKPKIKNKTFTLGYFSGSPTHAKDFRLIEPELIKFLNDFPDSVLKIVGYMEFSKPAQKLLKEGRIIFEKPVNYLKLQEKIASVNVNLAPLILNDFTNSKSELKFFEAAIVEVATVASPNFTFEKAIKDGKTGLLAKPGEWYKKLEFLYQNPSKNKEIAKNAKEYCLKSYYGEEFLIKIEAAYNKLERELKKIRS